MKNIFFAFLFVILSLLTGCSEKKNIEGDREVVFISDVSVEMSKGEKDKIKITNMETYTNYYGDGSILNKNIENLKVDTFIFDEINLAKRKFFTENYDFSNPVIVDNTIYYLDGQGNLISKGLYGDNAQKELWKVEIIDTINYSNYIGGKISFYNDVLYVSDGLNQITAINKNGDVLWKKKINSIPISSPVIQDNTLYIITNDNKTYALNTNDGSIEWIHYATSKDFAIIGSANPVIYKNYVISAYSSGELFVINKINGQEIFNSNMVGRYIIFSNFELTDINITPSIKNNILISSANNGITQAIDLNTMKTLWKLDIASLTNIKINGNYAYLITTNNNLFSINIKNGKIAWYTELDKYMDMEKKEGLIYYKYLTIINDKLFVYNNTGEYKIINPLNGKVESNDFIDYKMYSNPFSINGKLYILGIDGRNIILNISKD